MEIIALISSVFNFDLKPPIPLILADLKLVMQITKGLSH